MKEDAKRLIRLAIRRMEGKSTQELYQIIRETIFEELGIDIFIDGKQIVIPLEIPDNAQRIINRLYISPEATLEINDYGRVVVNDPNKIPGDGKRHYVSGMGFHYLHARGLIQEISSGKFILKENKNVPMR